ncbi:unnamed protein product [Pseudo-nitzschia multistriata]|uniref:Essential protein Yae1 N-terminal domain-containing protein n=1 Tax=Pseudo-nitzschia multistriata TaxID=183589 RepID=A0A448ZS71_9STRA|nr:unnamed protein product [Pseudo-nitzschia multistriata]
MTSNSDPFDCAFNSDLSDVQSTFDEVVLGGEVSAIEEGRVLGKEEGLLTGFREGGVLGHKTGIDYGMEIGFALGLLQAVRESVLLEGSDLTSSSSSLDRIRKSVDELEKAINDFPSSEEDIRRRLFQSSDKEKNVHFRDRDCDEEDGKNHNQQTQAEEDVRAQLQRIRARSKVLTARLGIPRHSLKNSMSEAAKKMALSTRQEETGHAFDGSGENTQEW